MKEVEQNIAINVLSQDIEEEKNLNNHFKKFINKIEIGLKEFLNLSNLPLKSEIYFETDFEVPSIKKIILLLKFENISFEDEIKIWFDLGKFIRKRIETIIESISEKVKNKFIGFNKAFYIKLDLSQVKI